MRSEKLAPLKRDEAMAAPQYPIATSLDEFARLKIQSDLFREDARAALQRLGSGAGFRVLDLCCGVGGITDVLSDWVGERGTVVGADIDNAKLEHARLWAIEGMSSNIEFVQADAFASGLDPASFDLAHTRFAISVIQDGIGILDHMTTLVRPGGFLFVEEADTQTMQCVPPSRDWDRALKLMKDAFVKVGANTSMGTALRGIFIDMGLTEVDVKICVHALTADDPMMMHLPLTLSAMRSAIVSLNLIEADDLDRLIERLAIHLAKPETMTISFSMVQVVGRLAESSQ
ncbi:MAG: class I SAM-dependent methyltransferase [Hyphomicrobiaceae bacterium]